MKLSIALMSLLISLSAYGKAIQYRTDIHPFRWNEFWEKQVNSKLRIDFDKGKDEFIFYSIQSVRTVAFILTRKQADSMMKGLDKYNEWNTIAIKKAVEIKKEITKVHLSATFWKGWEDEWETGHSSELTLHFFSQNTKEHQLIFKFQKLKRAKDNYSAHTPDTLFFNHGEAMKLRDALTNKSTEKFLIQAAKKAKIESEFK